MYINTNDFNVGDTVYHWGINKDIEIIPVKCIITNKHNNGDVDISIFGSAVTDGHVLLDNTWEDVLELRNVPQEELYSSKNSYYNAND